VDGGASIGNAAPVELGADRTAQHAQAIHACLVAPPFGWLQVEQGIASAKSRAARVAATDKPAHCQSRLNMEQMDRLRKRCCGRSTQRHRSWS
jgi:hypothetical protein